MRGNGWRATLRPLPALSQVLIKSIPNRCLAIIKSFAAVVGQRVLGLFITAIEISIPLNGATFGRASARVRWRLRKNEDWHSYSGSARLTPRKPHHCAALGEDSQTSWQPRLDFTDL